MPTVRRFSFRRRRASRRDALIGVYIYSYLRNITLIYSSAAVGVRDWSIRAASARHMCSEKQHALNSKVHKVIDRIMLGQKRGGPRALPVAGVRRVQAARAAHEGVVGRSRAPIDIKERRGAQSSSESITMSSSDA